MTKALPQILPIFPLSGVLLLPEGQLPLNIFEPRYIAMINDALATPERVIGMIQPKSDGELYTIGCAGRITEFSELPDGRYMLTLTGLCRFTIGRELSMHSGYRRVTPDWDDYLHDLDESPFAFNEQLCLERLMEPFKAYMDKHDIQCDWDLLNQVAPDPQFLTSLSMICPMNMREKQALLECETGLERTDMMIRILEMGCCGECNDAKEAAH